MIQSKIRIGIDYAPLTFSVGVSCTTPNSPTTQVYNENNGEYEPDRSVTPTVLQPTIIAGADDGSWHTGIANELLGSMKWYVNGKDISTLTDWSGLYEIDNSNTPMRGAITVKRNVKQREVFALRFEAVLPDARLGTTQQIVTEEITLSTTTKMEDEYSLSIEEGGVVEYNPIDDTLFLHEYKVAHGITSTKPARSIKHYDRSIPIKVYKGEKNVTTGFALKAYRVQANGSLLEVPNDDLAVSLSGTTLNLDMRLIGKEDIVVKLLVGGQEKGSTQVAIERAHPHYRVDVFGGTNITPRDWGHYSIASVHSNGNVVECAEAFIKMVWMTDTVAKKEVRHHEGKDTIIALKDTGIGSTVADSWLDIYIDDSWKPVMSQAIDSTGAELTDSDGAVLIFN